MSLAVSAQATTIQLGTGLDAMGNPLPHGANETRYTVGGNSSSATVWASGYPITPWVDGWVSPNSPPYGQWIRPNNEGVGFANYTMTISGHGSLSGFFTSDNPGALYVNGVQITHNDGWSDIIGEMSDQSSYNRWFAFTAQLNQPVNTVEWQVYNMGGPSGLIVRGAASVPDGGLTAMLLGVGVLGLGTVRRMVKAK